MIVKSLSRVRLFVTPWTAAHQAPTSMGFSRQEYWSGVPFLNNSRMTINEMGGGGVSPRKPQGENDPANPAESKRDLQQQSLIDVIIPISVGIQKS